MARRTKLRKEGVIPTNANPTVSTSPVTPVTSFRRSPYEQLAMS